MHDVAHLNEGSALDIDVAVATREAGFARCERDYANTSVTSRTGVALEWAPVWLAMMMQLPITFLLFAPPADTAAPTAEPAPTEAVVDAAPVESAPQPGPATETATASSPQPMPSERGSPTADRAERSRNKGLGMMIGGFATFTISYAASAFIGALSVDLADGDRQQAAYGRAMLIPVAGPFMAAPRAGSLTVAGMTGIAGVIQIGGLGLGAAGAAVFGRARARSNRLASVMAVPTRGGLAVSTTWRF